MVNCPNCGKVNPENAVFCEICGTLMSGAYSDNVPVEPETVTKVRKIGASGLMLAIAILQTLTVIISIPDVRFIGSNVNFGVNFPIMQLLVCIAFWLIYSTAKKPVGQLVSTAGLTIIRVLEMISIVGASLGMVLMLLLAVFSAIGLSAPIDLGSYGFFNSDVSTFLVFIIAVSVIGMVSMIVTLIKSICAYRFAGSVKNTVQSGFPECRSAAPLAFFYIISGLISTVGAAYIFICKDQINMYIAQFISVIEDQLSYYGQDIMLVASHFNLAEATLYITLAVSVVSAVLSILVAAIILKYRKTMKVNQAA